MMQFVVQNKSNRQLLDWMLDNDACALSVEWVKKHGGTLAEIFADNTLPPWWVGWWLGMNVGENGFPNSDDLRYILADVALALLPLYEAHGLSNIDATRRIAELIKVAYSPASTREKQSDAIDQIDAMDYFHVIGAWEDVVYGEMNAANVNDFFARSPVIDNQQVKYNPITFRSTLEAERIMLTKLREYVTILENGTSLLSHDGQKSLSEELEADKRKHQTPG